MWYLDWQRIGSIGYLLLALITVEMPTTAQRSQHGQKKGVRAAYLTFLLLLFISRVSQVYANKLSVCEEWPCNSTVPQLVKRELIISNNDSDGFENINQEVCSRCLKLYRAYSISFCSSHVGEFFWSWILNGCIKVQEKEKKVIVLFSRPPQKL